MQSNNIKNIVGNLIRTNLFPILFSLLFLALLLPFLNSIPHRDGNIDFVQTNDYMNGGLQMYLNNWNSVHPPLKIITSSTLIKLVPLLPFSYNILGIMLGITGIFGIYYFSLNAFTKKEAIISSSLLAISPLFIANAIFGLRDYILTIFIIISLFSYIKRRYIIYALFASLCVLTKETGLVLVFTVLLIEAIFEAKKIFNKRLRSIISFICCLIPLIPWYLWTMFLNSNHKNVWSDYVFSDAKVGPFSVVLHNLLVLNFFTQYAQQHWKQLFILNFNWIFWLFIVFSFLFYLLKKIFAKDLSSKIKKNEVKTKALIIIVTFFFFYLFTVLTFPTYTIPRYALPLIPLFIVFISLSITSIKNNYIKLFILVFVYSIFLISLFFSADPISASIWKVREIGNQNLYSLDQTIAGNDGITYNYQYLLLVKERTDLIRKIENSKLFLNKKDCDFIFPDPNNDLKTFMILKIDLNRFSICL
jgi:4-amino-4-deoxy-L-arabinose transferase-like glycosyltransferase